MNLPSVDPLKYVEKLLVTALGNIYLLSEFFILSFASFGFCSVLSIIPPTSILISGIISFLYYHIRNQSQ